MNDRELYEILNEIEVDREDLVYEKVGELEKIRVKKKIRKEIKIKNYKKYVGVAGLSFLALGGGLLIAKPAIAYEIPIIGDFLLEKKIENKEYKKYVEIVGKEIKIDERKLTLTAAVMDNNKLEVSYDLTDTKGRLKEDNEEVFDFIHFLTGTLFIDGEKASEMGGGDWKFIDSNNMKIHKVYDLTKPNLKEEANIEIRIYELFKKKGDFGFKFVLDNKEINKNSINLENVKTTNKNIEIKSFNVTPLSLKVTAKVKGFNEMIAIDNNSNILEGGQVGSSGMGDIKEDYFEYIPKENMEWVKFIPVKSKWDEVKRGEIKESLEKPIKLDFNFKDKRILLEKYRGVDIKEVKRDGDYVVILHKPWAKKDFYNFNTDIYLKEGGKVLKNDSSNEKEYEKFKKYEKEGYDLSYFKVDSFKDLEIGIRHYKAEEFLEGESFTVKLK